MMIELNLRLIWRGKLTAEERAPSVLRETLFMVRGVAALAYGRVLCAGGRFDFCTTIGTNHLYPVLNNPGQIFPS